MTDPHFYKKMMNHPPVKKAEMQEELWILRRNLALLTKLRKYFKKKSKPRRENLKWKVSMISKVKRMNF